MAEKTVCDTHRHCLFYPVTLECRLGPIDDFATMPFNLVRGWSGGAMVLGKLPVPTIWISVGQGPAALAVCAGEICLDIFTHDYLLSPLYPSLSETARYRLKYCLKGPLNPQQQKKSILSCFQLHITL